MFNDMIYMVSKKKKKTQKKAGGARKMSKETHDKWNKSSPGPKAAVARWRKKYRSINEVEAKNQKYPVVVGYGKVGDGPWLECWSDGKFRTMPLHRRILKCFRLL